MNPEPNPAALYIEDLFVGQKFTSGPHLMEADRIKSFAAEFDPQPFHMDEVAAEHSVFHGLSASGWHTAAVGMRLMATGNMKFAGGLIGFGGEFSWPRPTRPGDVLTLESEILDITISRSKPQQGVVTVKNVVSNQAGEPVYILTVKALAFRRPASEL
jgi:acyl dehydratase